MIQSPFILKGEWVWLVSAAICFSTSLKNYFYLNKLKFFLQHYVGFCHTTMPKVLGSFVLAAVHVGLVTVFLQTSQQEK